MLFNSWEFALLVVLTLCVYYLPMLRRRQVGVLMVASCAFYAYNDCYLLGLLLLSAIINAATSYGALYGNRPRLHATIGLVVNLSALILFKYSHLIATFLPTTDDGIGHYLCMLPLPLGISFYTFSGISLVADAYKGHIEKPAKKVSFLKHLKRSVLYVVFFPKLLAGPIAKSDAFFSQIAVKHFHDIDWTSVFKTLVTGYFLKMVIADNLKDFTFWMAFRYCEHMHSGSLLLMLFGYSVQMFADFAGYSLIAIGVARLFGYRLPTNFNFPYIASSFRDFWKRWHITLSQFLMEYLYIALGGNRKGKTRTYLNLMLTMMLGGLWHGAALSYLAWGTYHGFCLVAERIVCGRRDNCIALGRSPLLTSVSHWLSVALVFVAVSFGWLLFKLPFGEACRFVIAIFTNIHGETLIEPRLMPILLYIIPVAVYHALYSFRNRRLTQRLLRYDYVFYGIMLFLIATNSGSANQFVYFQF